MNDNNGNKKLALITGCAKRVARQIALALASDGFDIAIHYNNSYKEANVLKEEIKGIGRNSEIFKADLFDVNQAIEMIRQVKKTFPDLNLLINSASIFEKQSFLETDINSFDNNINIHVKSVFFLIQEFTKMTEKGNIINIIDSYTLSNNTPYFPYLLSKKALLEMSLMLAKELAPKIRLNMISPGIIMPPERQDNVETKEYYRNKLPTQQLPSVDDVIKAVRMVIENDYLWGQNILVDGGRHLV